MKLKQLLAFFVLVVYSSFAQIDTTRKEFFPLHIGDLWQYRDENNKLAIQQVIGDTILDSERYFLLIHSLRTSGGVTRIDSQIQVTFYGGGVIFRLGERNSTLWPTSDTFWGLPTPQPVVRFNGITTSGVFGAQREIMHFDFGGTISGAPYDTLWGFGALLAKGIGVIQEQYYEGDYYILQGAIIDGVQYGTIVSVEDLSETIPKQIALYQNYPNPFNPSTVISYQLSVSSYVTLKIIDLLGREITTLVNKEQQRGNYQIHFTPRNLSGGIYFVRISAGSFIATNKIIYSK